MVGYRRFAPLAAVVASAIFFLPAEAAQQGISVALNSPRGISPIIHRADFFEPSLPPMAFTRFCMEYPGDCEVGKRTFWQRPIDLTDALVNELKEVNLRVNRGIVSKRDDPGTQESWIIFPTLGDCNDYAVTKRHELLALGWPSRALLLAEVVVPSGEHHLVLIVRTRQFDLVLDNLNYNVRPIADVRYRWLRAQSPRNPKFWSKIAVSPAVRTANAADDML